jgi:DNA polymerase/3'-5' exonuclease PolX
MSTSCTRPADGLLCVIPENQPIYDALIAKAASYPPQDIYKAATYRKVAHSVATLNTNLYPIIAKYGYFYGTHIPYLGCSTGQFIINFIKSPHTVCTVPENQPIYQALITKAATYPADQPWKAKAYKKAAESIATYNKNIFKDYELENTCYGIPYVGDSIEEFIYNFINTTTKKIDTVPQSSIKNTFAAKGMLLCVIPDNQPIYQALIDKAVSYPESGNNIYKIKAYLKAAESVAAFEKNIFYEYELNNICEGIPHVGNRIEDFIDNFIDTTTNKCVVPSNQHIYQVLIDKAASYPPSKVWKREAYNKAASIVADYPVDIIKDASITNFPKWLQGMGSGTKNFVFQTFINNRPKRCSPL